MLQTAPQHIQIAKVLHHELEKVEKIFCDQLASDLPAVNDLCRHVERYRGKMLRRPGRGLHLQPLRWPGRGLLLARARSAAGASG